MSTTQRRLGLVLVACLVLGGLAWLNRARPVREGAVFTQLGKVSPPFAPTGDQLTGSWFCPGVPHTGTGTGGRLVISNPTDRRLEGMVTTYSNDRSVPAVTTSIEVPKFDTLSVDLVELQPTGTYLSAMVELAGGQGLVEQRAIHPAGDAVWPCSNAASAQWYFADGFTANTSAENLLITNPFDSEAIVDIQLVTGVGTRTPSQLQGLPIRGESMTTIDLSAIARNEAVVAIKVVAARGRIVAARAQHYTGGGRLGYSLSLGAPSLYDQFYFADETVSSDRISRYSIYNPNTEPVEITVLPIAPDLNLDDLPEPVTVEPGEVRTLVLSNGENSDLTKMPSGNFGMVFAAATGTPAPFIVERATTRTTGGVPATSVLPGIPGETVSRRWSTVISPQVDTSQALRVLNVDNQPGTITVWALGDAGFEKIPGLDAIEVGATATVAIDLEGLPADLRGRPLIIDCTHRTVVERSLQRGGSPGRSLSIVLNG